VFENAAQWVAPGAIDCFYLKQIERPIATLAAAGSAAGEQPSRRDTEGAAQSWRQEALGLS